MGAAYFGTTHALLNTVIFREIVYSYIHLGASLPKSETRRDKAVENEASIATDRVNRGSSAKIPQGSSRNDGLLSTLCPQVRCP